MLATLRESGSTDLIIFELLEYLNKEDDIFSFINDKLFYYIFFIPITINDLRGKSQSWLKSQYKSWITMIFVIYFNFCLFLDRGRNGPSAINHEILKVFDFFLFVSIFFLIKRKLKNLSIGSLLILTNLLTSVLTHSLNNIESPSFSIINIFTMQLTIYYISISLSNLEKRRYLTRCLLFILLIIDMNFHFNQISIFYYSGHIHNLVLLLIKNLFLIVYWFLTIVSCITLFEIITKHFPVPKIIKRKFFHLLAVMIYLPGYLYMEEDLLFTISITVIYLMILLELIRNKLHNKKIFIKISEYLKSNIDERDNNKFIVTHIFLLYGCFSSLLYMKVSNQKDSTRWEYNILSLAVSGVGDAMASVIGSIYGKIKIFPPTNRSLEGFCSGFISTFIFIALCSYSYYFNLRSLVCIILIFLYEGFTLQIDNLVLPVMTNKIFTLLH